MKSVIPLSIGAGLLCLLAAASVRAQDPFPPVTATTANPASSVPVPAKAGTPAVELTSHDVETFLDGLIPEQLLRNDTAGATISVVKDGQVLLAKGYGFADYRTRTPVSADTTLFRPGSITKLFTATAVMQLVEAGKLDLDRNVNDYLDFALPDTFPEPITLRRLLTHTAGFEETVANLFVAGPAPMLSLSDYVHRSVPTRIFAPGTVSAYSNYGVALAGYIVERVSGEPFAADIDAHILTPLRMTHSSCVQPLPPGLAPLLSKGYPSADEEPVAFELVAASPAGALSATAADMARFMMAFLGGGSLEGAQILRPESVREMWRRQFETHPALNAMGLVFYQESQEGGATVVGHAGDTVVFHSELFLVPEAKVGVFVSYNTAGVHPARDRGELRQAFLDRYFPAAPPHPAAVPPADARRDAAAVAGQYQTTRRTETNFLKLVTLLDQSSVTAQADGSLTVSDLSDLRGHPIRWEPVGSLVYREKDGRRSIAFRRDAQGRVTTLDFHSAVQEALRARWFENQKFALPLIGAGLVTLLATTLLWPVAAVVRRYHRKPLAREAGRGTRALFVLSRVVCVLDALVMVGWLVLFSLGGANPSVLGDMHTLSIRLLYALGWIGAAGIVVVLASALAMVRQGKNIRRWPKVHQWILLAACLIDGWLSWHWHLLG